MVVPRDVALIDRLRGEPAGTEWLGYVKSLNVHSN